MICQQTFIVSSKTANHLANTYALEYNITKISEHKKGLLFSNPEKSRLRHPEIGTRIFSRKYCAALQLWHTMCPHFHTGRLQRPLPSNAS